MTSGWNFEKKIKIFKEMKFVGPRLLGLHLDGTSKVFFEV
jgi:hypothetical protein